MEKTKVALTVRMNLEALREFLSERDLTLDELVDYTDMLLAEERVGRSIDKRSHTQD